MRATVRCLPSILTLALALGLPAAAAVAETEQVGGFGTNPGGLLMFKYVPDSLPSRSPLVVALHGCSQSATAFDDESGWTELAERLRFAVLLPEQQEANNDTRCFNFFSARHNRRDQGEAASIRAMIEAMKAQHDIDPNRIFVTGLSAGGAMTAVMLAAYPDVFKAGAIIAGLPYGCASTGGSFLLEGEKAWWVAVHGEAGWASYRCGIDPTGLIGFAPFSRAPSEWREILVEARGPSTPAWPKVSLWHGAVDRRVHPANLRELKEQWTAAHGIDPEAGEERTGSGIVRRREYKDARGEVRVETVEIPTLGHALPINPGPGADQCGREAPYFAPVGVCAAHQIARFWALDR